MKKFFLCMFFVILPGLLLSQSAGQILIDSISNNFLEQVKLYPQEKIYAQTDKSYYITGEDIWFRAYLVDGISMTPDSKSRYVYAELIDPLDSVQVRVKIQPKDGAFYGHISLEEDLPTGEYQLRFYTKYMQGRGDSSFFKRTIKIGDPLSALYRTELRHEYVDKDKINIELSFSDIEKNERIRPDEIRIRDTEGALKKVKYDEDGVAQFSLKKMNHRNVVYLEYDYFGKFHKEFVPVSRPVDYVVSFLPEGGHVIMDGTTRIAFKSLNSDGLGEDIQGVLVNEKGDTLTSFSSQHQGMGMLNLYTKQAEERYYAICKNAKGVEKKFELPRATPGTVSIQANFQKDNLYVALKKSSDFANQPLYLLVQTRGILLDAFEWGPEDDFITLNRDRLPSGITQLLVIDGNKNPLSERLVFNVNKKDLAGVNFEINKENFKKREKVEASLSLIGSGPNSELSSVAISVTDDNDFVVDTCVNILTTLLMTSDLKGYIENPAYYFKGEDPKTMNNLDLLMMTQGWSQYNVSKVLRGDLEKPKMDFEQGPEISGTVESGILLNRKSADYPVKIVSFQYNFFEETVTDSKGRFTFKGFEWPDSTQFVIQGNTKKGGNRVWMTVDEDRFPLVKNSLPFEYRQEQSLFANYLKKADQKFVLENGMRMIYLEDVEIRAKKSKREKGKSSYSSSFNPRVTSEEIENDHDIDIFQTLSKISGVWVSGDKVSVRGYGDSPLIMVDDVPYESGMLSSIPIETVDEIEVVKDAGTVVFGPQGANGVILITTKRGIVSPPKEQFNIKSVSPLGYQITKEFYSPQYETVEQGNRIEPDLRSTIYWNPSVGISNTDASNISFYTSDQSTTYSVIIEGVTSGGRLIHSVHKIKRED